jgi:hypothetical protein
MVTVAGLAVPGMTARRAGAQSLQRPFARRCDAITTGGENMTKALILSLCVAASSLPLSAHAQDVRKYVEGPVTEVDYIHVDYGHFEEYIDWLRSTWKPYMEALKKAGLIIDYKVLMLTPKSPDQPNISLHLTFKDGAAAFDRGVEKEDIAKKVIGSTEVQNKARVGRNDYRRVLGNEYVRELILK